jgi:hypothetical protein
MLRLVPSFKGFDRVESVIGTKVDHFHPLLQEFRHKLRGDGMRQAAEDTLGTFRNLLHRQLFERHVQPPHERLVYRTDWSGFVQTGQSRDLRVRMPKQNFDKFNGGITTSPENCYCCHNEKLWYC